MGQYFTLVLVLRCFLEPHPICVADGICQYFCSGMGLLTLMYRASFIALLRLCSSLPTMLEVLNTYIMTSHGMVVKYGGGAFDAL